MPTKILLIENDSAFASQLAESLEASGFDVRVGPEGKAGLDLAREWGPSGIVLCVELPGMSGYLVCQKLRKDDGTKAIPLVLTSAEATADTFEKHKALKVRADEYLLKPYAPGALLDKLAALGLAAPAPAAVPDEFEGLSDEPAAAVPGDLPGLDLESLPDEPAPSPEPAELSLEDDLAFLDEAFEGLEAPHAAKEAKAEEDDDLSASADSLSDDDSAAGAGLGGLDVEAEDPLAGLEETVAPLPSDALQAAALELTAEPPAEDPPVRGASADALRAAGIPLLEPERPATRPTPPPSQMPAPAQPSAPSPRPTLSGLPIPGSLRAAKVPPPPAAPAPARPTPEPSFEPAASDRGIRELAEVRSALSAREAEARQLRGRAEEAARRAEAAEAAASEHEAELASVRAKLDTITAQARRADQELKAAREEGRRAVDEIDTLRSSLAEAERRAEDLPAQAARVEELERELESARTELVVARGEVEGARGEVEARAAELQKRISELEALGAKHEERVLKAYQKIKGDEKVKDRVRKALAIAAQLLEEGLPPEQAPAEAPYPQASPSGSARAPGSSTPQ